MPSLNVQRPGDWPEDWPGGLPAGPSPQTISALVEVCLTILLTVPTLLHIWKSFNGDTKSHLQGGYVQLSEDSGGDKDKDAATEESIKAYSDFVPRVSLWIASGVGLCASLVTVALAFSLSSWAWMVSSGPFLWDVTALVELMSWVCNDILKVAPESVG